MRFGLGLALSGLESIEVRGYRFCCGVKTTLVYDVEDCGFGASVFLCSGFWFEASGFKRLGFLG